MSKSLALCALLLLVGCATTPTPVGQAVPVPAQRVYFASPAAGQPAAQIVVIRDTGLQGGGVYAHFFINEKKAASLNPGEILRMSIPTGDFSFGVHLTDPLHAEEMFSVDQSVKEGKTYYYRILVDRSGARLQRTATE